jgi:hypothetical protein
MGLFNFLKKKQKPQRLRRITLEQVSTFFDEQEEHIADETEFATFQEQLKSHKENVQEALQKLDQAELLNTKIPPRALHILNGNRTSFIKRTQRLLNEITIPQRPHNLDAFSTTLFNAIESFGQDTRKNSMVIKEFLEDELKEVIKHIHHIEEDTHTLLKQLKKTPLDHIIQGRALLKDHAAAKTTAHTLKTQRQTQKEELEHLEAEQQELENELTTLKDSEAYHQAQQTAQAVASQKIILKNIMVSVRDHFSPFERQLRKFQHDSLDEELISMYLADPGTALLDDPDLKIIDVLLRLQEKIPSLETDQKRVAKIQDAIALVNRDVLFSLQEQLLAASEELAQQEEQQRSTNILREVEEKQHLSSSLGAAISKQKQDLEKEKEKATAKEPHDELQELNDILLAFHATLIKKG